MKRSEATRAKWARVVEAQARSGMSAAEFCRGRGIWASSFFAWKRTLGVSGTSAATTPGFVEAKVGRGDRADDYEHDGIAGGIVIEVARESGGSKATGRRRLTVCRGFDRQLLLDVIETLESRGANDDAAAPRGRS